MDLSRVAERAVALTCRIAQQSRLLPGQASEELKHHKCKRAVVEELLAEVRV